MNELWLDISGKVSYFENEECKDLECTYQVAEVDLEVANKKWALSMKELEKRD